MKKPARHEIRVGSVVASIRTLRRHETTHYRVGVFRLFRDGNVWTKSTRFDVSDIPALRFALDEAQTWILEKQQEFKTGGDA